MSNTFNPNKKNDSNGELAGELLDINLGFFDRLLTKFDQMSAQNNLGIESHLGFEALGRFVMTAKATAAQKKQLDERIAELEVLLEQSKKRHDAQEAEKRGFFEKIKLLEETIRKQEDRIQKSQGDYQSDRIARQANFEKLEKQAIQQLERSAERLQELMQKNDVLRKELQALQVLRVEEQTEHRERVDGLEERLKASEANVSQLKSEMRFMEKRLKEDLSAKDASLVRAAAALNQFKARDQKWGEQLRNIQVEKQVEVVTAQKKMQSISAAVGNERRRADQAVEQLSELQTQLSALRQQQAKWQEDSAKAAESVAKAARIEAAMSQQKIEIEQLRHINESLKKLLQQTPKKPPLPVIHPKIQLETPELELEFPKEPAAAISSMDADWGKTGKC